MPPLLIATWRELVTRPVLKGSACFFSMSYCCLETEPQDRDTERPNTDLCCFPGMLLQGDDADPLRSASWEVRVQILSCEVPANVRFCSYALSELVAAGSSEEHAIPEGGRPQLDKGLFCMLKQVFTGLQVWEYTFLRLLLPLLLLPNVDFAIMDPPQSPRTQLQTPLNKPDPRNSIIFQSLLPRTLEALSSALPKSQRQSASVKVINNQSPLPEGGGCL